MSLWDELPSALRDSGELDSLRPLLDGLNGTGPTQTHDDDGDWSTYTATEDLRRSLSLDPMTGAFSTSSGSTGTPLEFPDPSVTVELSFHLTAPAGSRDGGWKVVLGTPRAILRLPFLRGATLDGQGQLRADPSNPVVSFLLPALRVKVKQLSGQAVSVELMSAATSGVGVDKIYDFVRMDPPYALVGPSEVVGFAFRAAVLDLSGTAGPSGVPSTARAMPGAWQGLYLPEARLFVAPEGLSGLAVSGGVRDLWIGIGAHEGVTGIFEAEVVNRGSAPTIRVRLMTATGEWIEDPGTGTAQVPETSTLYVDSSGGVAPYTVSITVDGVTTVDDRVAVLTPSSGTVSISVTVRDGLGHDTTRAFTTSRRAAAVAGGAGETTVRLTHPAGEQDVMVLVSQTPAAATVRLASGAPATWMWPTGTSTGASATIPVASGASVAVIATTTGTTPKALDCYFLFDHPSVSEGHAYAVNPDNTHAGPALDRSHHSTSPRFIDDARARVTEVGAATQLLVSGYASYEGDPSTIQEERNRALSERRRQAMLDALAEAGFTNVVQGAADGTTAARAGTALDLAPVPPPGSGSWWRARAVTPAAVASVTAHGQLSRPVASPPASLDPTPPNTGTPDCFRKLGVRVDLVRGTFVRLEIYGEIDIETAAETQLRRHAKPALRQGPRNPDDGICTFLGRLRIAEDQSSWILSAEFRAVEGDLDGLAEMKDSNANQVALDILGAVSLFAPLSSATSTLSPAAGAVIELGAIALGASDLIHTKRLVLRGAELIVSQGVLGADGITTVDRRGTQVSVLFDLEIAFSFDLTIVKVDPAHPITTRYKAVGVRSTWNTAPGQGNAVDYLPIPFFDPSRGYSIDIPTGSLTAVPPLDNLLRILGGKVSKDNPTYLEIEVGLGVELGVVKVDTVRVRARVDGPPLDVQLTKLGATISIPNVLQGSGYLAFVPGGFEGAFDLQLIPLKLRGSATLKFQSVDGVTGLLLGLEVEFPVPLVLGSSGLGLFGLMAGIGINYERIEDASLPVPALRWLEGQFATPYGVMAPAGWRLSAGHYAFAAGVLLGTLEGGYVVHLKGIILIEVPGPRLLFVLKADVIKAPPVLKSTQSATFLAVLDLDFGRGTITIGIVAEYEIAKILKIRVPVTAFFDTKAVEKWFVDLGSYTDRVTVEVLDVISGSGYLMIHGDGLSIPGLPPVPNGLAIATGFHISAVLMGSKSIGLYLEVAAGFDAVVGFDPFFIAGKIYARGELRLFIISIGASAELTVMVGKRLVNGVLQDQPYVNGEVCGSIDLFFFEIKGCVSLTIGSQPDDDPTAKPLVAGVSLVSRSPALLEGTATERAVDASLGDARSTTSSSADPLLSVPLDAIPVITFNVAPTTAGSAVMGGDPLGHTGASANPWTRIGDRWWRYEVQSVTLTGDRAPDLQPVPPTGKTPSTWWTGAPPGQPVATTALALLNWLPTPFSRAVPFGSELVSNVEDRWGTVCHPAAPAVPVLWTFDDKPYGPSQPGWVLRGIPWPDPADTVRSEPVEADLTVTEPWRTGVATTDLMQGTQPAIVMADSVACTVKGVGVRRNALLAQPATAAAATTFSNHVLPRDGAVQDELVSALAAGVSLHDFAAHRALTAWDPATGATPMGCTGAVLRSPRFDSPDPAPRGTADDRAMVQRSWKKSGSTPDALLDAVRLRTSSAARRMSILLIVPERALGGALRVRLEDAKGAVVLERALASSDLISPAHPVPAPWTDASGPWLDPVVRAAQVAQRVMSAGGSPTVFALVDLVDVPGEFESVVIGWDAAATKQVEPGPFYVVAATGLLVAEAWREDWDTQTVSQNTTALTTALTQDPDDRALLVPSGTYTVSVTWKSAWLKQDARPGAGDPVTWQTAQTQSYRFATDPVEKSPADLSPWLLATAPGMGDIGVFCTQPVRIAFATQKVAELYDAYGKELRIVVRSASGTHPAPPGGTAGSPWTVPLVADAHLSSATALDVPTPWEEAVMGGLDRLPCIPATGERSRHEVLTLPYDFEPLTDYLIDIHAVPQGSPSSTTGLVHRISFTTSRFADLTDFVGFIAPATVRARLVPVSAPLLSLSARPTGDQVDAAYQASGLAVPQTPSFPSVELLWSGDAVPQPVAVVIESSEPLWRSRVMPEIVTGPIDATDPLHHWWAGVRDDWLRLEDSTAPVAAGDPPRAVVTSLVRCPGDTRVIAVLAPGSRGQELRLDLVVAADQLAAAPAERRTVVRVSLARAPWEVED